MKAGVSVSIVSGRLGDLPDPAPADQIETTGVVADITDWSRRELVADGADGAFPRCTHLSCSRPGLHG
jgi:hypothetical protein